MKCFLDPDYTPPPELAKDFEAGRKAEIERRESPQEVEKWKKVADEIGSQIAKGIASIAQ